MLGGLGNFFGNSLQNQLSGQSIFSSQFLQPGQVIMVQNPGLDPFTGMDTAMLQYIIVESTGPTTRYLGRIYKDGSFNWSGTIDNTPLYSLEGAQARLQERAFQYGQVVSPKVPRPPDAFAVPVRVSYKTRTVSERRTVRV